MSKNNYNITSHPELVSGSESERTTYQKSVKRCAFTMAELLITIGIIGVVAALTIPMLANNANSKKFASQYKKTLSSLAQASLMSQARYYIDYSNLSEDSSDASCRSDALSSGNNSMCGLFNNVFSAKSYKGTYGNVSGILPLSKYSIQTTSQGFNPDGFMIYSLSDGAIVGFNPNAKGCSLEEGTRVNNEAITGSLANCVGFIDVNGVSLPNREVTCDTSSETSLSPNTACSIQKANGDVFPVVFHNGTVEPATNAARAILNAARSSAGEAGAGDDTTSAQPVERRKITLNGRDYELYSGLTSNINLNGTYLYEDENGNLIGADGTTYTKRDDGKYEITQYGRTYLYDSDMNPLGVTKDGQWYDYNRNLDSYISQLDNGNYLSYTGKTYTKRDDGKYEMTSGSYTYLYDSDMKTLGLTYVGNWYDYMASGSYIRPGNAAGVYVDPYSHSYTKRDDGKYEWNYNGYYRIYDSDLNELGFTYNGKWYDHINGKFVRTDDNGNYVGTSGTTYTKREDGLYEYGGYVYDEELRQIGKK